MSLRSLLGHRQSKACRGFSRSMLRWIREHVLWELVIARSAARHFNTDCQCMQEHKAVQTPNAEQSGPSRNAQHSKGDFWSWVHNPCYNENAQHSSCCRLEPSRTQGPVCSAAHICQLLKALGLLWFPDGLLAGNVHQCFLGLWVDPAAQADVHALLPLEGPCSTAQCSDRQR